MSSTNEITIEMLKEAYPNGAVLGIGVVTIDDRVCRCYIVGDEITYTKPAEGFSTVWMQGSGFSSHKSKWTKRTPGRAIYNKYGDLCDEYGSLEKRGVFLPRVDPAFEATWNRLLRHLARVDEPGQFLFRKDGNGLWSLTHYNLEGRKVSVETFRVGTNDPALALVLAQIKKNGG